MIAPTHNSPNLIAEVHQKMRFYDQMVSGTKMHGATWKPWLNGNLGTNRTFSQATSCIKPATTKLQSQIAND
jgi:hypothetical protein